MQRSRWYAATVGVLLAVGVFIWWAFPQLPAQVPSHWNINGEVDAYSDPLTTSLLFPGIVVVVSGLLMGFARVERNVVVGDALIRMSTLMALFLGSLHVIITLSALGYGFTVERWIAGLLGLLFVGIGRMMDGIPQNGFFGIRTYWTLTNSTVWDETHRSGSRWMMVGGLVTVVLALLPIPAVWLFAGMLTAIFVSVGYPMFHAYRRFHQLVG